MTQEYSKTAWYIGEPFEVVGMNETREQFEQRYTKQQRDRGEAVYRFGDNHISMPCICDDSGGPTHWACVLNTPGAIQAHLDHQSVLRELQEAKA